MTIHLKGFTQTFALSCLITNPVCHQSKIATCIDFVPTKKINLFKMSDILCLITVYINFKDQLKKKCINHRKSLIWMSLIILHNYNSGNHNSDTLFEEEFLSILNKQALLKTKLLRYNNNASMSQELSKSIMLRSKLKNAFNKNGPMKTGVNINTNVT